MRSSAGRALTVQPSVRMLSAVARQQVAVTGREFFLGVSLRLPPGVPPSWLLLMCSYHFLTMLSGAWDDC